MLTVSCLPEKGYAVFVRAQAAANPIATIVEAHARLGDFLTRSNLNQAQRDLLNGSFVLDGFTVGEDEDAGAFEVRYLNRNARPEEQVNLAARHALLPNAVNVADARGGVIFTWINNNRLRIAPNPVADGRPVVESESDQDSERDRSREKSKRSNYFFALQELFRVPSQCSCAKRRIVCSHVKFLKCFHAN